MSPSDSPTDLDPTLLELVRCPQCHGVLDVQESGLVCEACSLRYPVRGGVPVLLVDDAEPLDGSPASGSGQS